MRRTRAVAVFLFPFLLATSAAAAEFPDGTIRFIDTRAAAAIPAFGGGIWVGTPQGLARYTEAGAGATFPTPGGGAPRNLVIAPDGSIWFAANTLIARISPNGAILEQHPMSAVGALAVAPDGALWYSRGSLGEVVGRIADNVPTEFPSPTQSWSLAPAGNGQMWVLGNGFGTGSDNLYRMTPTGAVTVLPLGHDVLFGNLQALPDGTLYIGTGIRRSVLRLAPGAQTVEVVSLPGSEYLSDSAGDLWVAGYQVLGYIARSGVPNVSVTMPGDPRQLLCSNIPAYLYQPVAIDSTGGLWVLIFDAAFYIGESPPCNEPDPPPMPDLIRIDTAQFLAANAPGYAIPTLSTAMLVALAIALALVTIWHIRV
jgi:streptogramin lyase